MRGTDSLRTVTLFDWPRKAADQGDADAQNSLGDMYRNGRGVAQDEVQAHKRYDLAALSGDAGAMKNRNLVAAKMTPTQLVEARKLATEFKPRFKTAGGRTEKPPSHTVDSPEQGWMWWIVLLGLVPLRAFFWVKSARDG